MKRPNDCPECGTPLNEVPSKRCAEHDRVDALLAGLMNVRRTTQHRIDEVNEAAAEEREEARLEAAYWGQHAWWRDF